MAKDKKVHTTGEDSEGGITYLGLDRLDLAHPEQAIYRMVRKGILKPIKIGRFLAFSKSDLEYVITNGEKKRTPGRPRKIEKIMSYENTV